MNKPQNLQFPTPTGEDFSGKIIFDINEINKNKITFHCGPETTDGALSDWCEEFTNPVLAKLFADHEIYIGAAENFHEITNNPGETSEDLKQLIETRLTNAGAIKIED